ncbi:N-formylglutamate amidohydrolase [Rhodococcus hoagii]|uniref:N-formylglutamate amidohydrolase n=1 Tax=Rhodococcus hoagii TaxID=43767 RepID=UPI0019E87646|nr:N-formylglutamate amidohydrolase [Prescottella equi]NKV32972.1 N-formylglutamate amidohydrolase [Prescottella equi]WJJ14654.1 N-formylglutamate amidohydrolase [Prescottella equi]
MTDRAGLEARIRQEHAHELPTFRDPAALDTAARTVTAQSLEAPGTTLTVTITCQRFAVEARGSDPAASGTAVTVSVASTDAASGARRHIQLAEPEAWARAVFAEFDDDERRIYLLGGVDADTGRPEFGLVSYRLYVDDRGVPVRVPIQLLTLHHYWVLPLE